MSMDPKEVVASFDSASVLHAATVAALEHRPFPHLGSPAVFGQLVRVAAKLPWPILKQVYARIGGAEGIDPARLGEVDMHRVAASFTAPFTGRYPGVFVGSSNGALTQLAAATGMPWLPGTVLVPVHRIGEPSRPDLALQFGRQVGPRLLDANGDIVIHQMHDAAQDELMVARMSYFRTKWNALPSAYANFFEQHLEPGAPIILVQDESTWPVTRISDRHVFQVGGRGGLTPDEYLSRPHSPAANDTAPEAEWGADPDFSENVIGWATRSGHPIVKIVVDGPQEAAHPVAIAIRTWIRERGGDADTLIVPSFVLGDPWRTIETAQVPFWTYFPVQSALESLQFHLTHTDPYSSANILVFQHGAFSPGIATAADFAAVLRDMGTEPTLLALRPTKSPHDIGSLGRYGGVMKRMPNSSTPFVRLSVTRALDLLRETSSERGRSIVPHDEGTAVTSGRRA